MVLMILLFCYQARKIFLLKEDAPSFSTIALISAFSAYKLPAGQVLTMDGYHTGEMLIPFQQFFSQNLASYSDFVSVHGLLAVSYGFINHLFFDATYATVAQAFALTDSIYAGVMAALLCLWLEPRIALFLGLFILPC